MKIVTISSKRQVTIPKSFLEVLGLESYGKAILEKEKDKVVIKPMKRSIVEQTAGSLKKFVKPSLLGKSIDYEEKAVGMLIGRHAASEGLK